MKASNFELADYLARIGFRGEAGKNLHTLRELMRCHLFSIPFENLDVQAGKVVSLVPEDIVDKIIYRGRGGYCYEINGLFAMALTALGIEYQFLGARPMFYPMRRPKTHMVIVAKVDDKDWLCDLGFGSYGIRAPIGLHQLDEIITQDYDQFMLTKTNPQEYLVQALVDGEWKNQFGFDLYPQEWIDFMPVNYLNSTHPDTIFVQKLLVICHTPEGRKILLGDQLKVIAKGVVEQRQLAEGEIHTVLQNEFGLVANKQ